MRDYLLIYLNGQRLQVNGSDALLNVSDFLRKQRRMTGTKVVCAEGDCGACAVLIGRLQGERLVYKTVASCIQMMFQLDCTHIVTVEGLADGNSHNPVQEAMVNCHGAQCGFCTPGFVVSLYDIMQSKQPVDAHCIRRGLVGNLCRCTGYDSIVRAGLATDRAKIKSVETIYPTAIMLGDLTAASAEAVQIKDAEISFHKPTTINNACEFLRDNPGCLIISGATDLGVQRNKGLRQFTTVMSTAGLEPLRQIATEPNAMIVGAAVTMTELENATASTIPELSRFLAYFGSPMIKNAATIAGNLVNASPIGDSIPALMVLGAQIEITGTADSRWVHIDSFYTGYRKTVLSAGEMVTRVRIPLLEADDIFKLYKISKRKDLDISAVSAAIRMTTLDDTIQSIQIAVGGVGPTVVHLPQTQAMLTGAPLTLESFTQASVVARSEVKPISDVRGSEAYRRILAGNILIKFWHDLHAEMVLEGATQ